MHSNPSNYDGKCSYLTDPRIVVCTFNCSHSMWISLENWGAAVGCSPGKIASPWWTFSIRGPFTISNVFFCFFFFTWLATTCMENLIKRNPMTHQYRPPHQLYLRAVQFKAKPPLQKQKKNEKKTLKKPCHFLCSYILGSAFLFYFFFSSDIPAFLFEWVEQVFRGKPGGLLGCHSNAANASLYVSNSGVGSHICSYSALLCLAFSKRKPPLYIYTPMYICVCVHGLI